MVNRDEPTPEDWGFPRRRREEVLGAYLWNEDYRRQRLGRVVQDSIGVEYASRLLTGKNFDPDELEQEARDNDWVVIDLGEAGKVLPLWQFEPDMENPGSMRMLPGVRRAWLASGKVSPISFHEDMREPWPQLKGRTPLDVIRQGDEAGLEEIEFHYKHGMDMW